VIPGDLSAEIDRVLEAAVAAGELPAQVIARRRGADGTWRLAPARPRTSTGTTPAWPGAGTGTYATSLPLTLARSASRDPLSLASSLAASLARVPWIASAAGTGAGYLTISVTPGHLAGLAARIVAAGPAAIRSQALAGTRAERVAQADLTCARTWAQAWNAQRDILSARLAAAAGAQVSTYPAERNSPPGSSPQAGPGPVPDAIDWFGADAVGYALAGTSAPASAAIERQLSLPLDLDNPYFAVRYARALAASTLRWADDLAGFASAEVREPTAGELVGSYPMTQELAVLDAMSWLPERIAAAARRRRPAELTAQLERVSAAWLGCAADCPALPFGGQAAPADPEGPLGAARLELAAAAAVALSAGLGLLGVSAPDWL
jgi:arginyl-tRNA synthetase